ncbi:MAG: 50S ribosomal protein L18 [Candidatus Pacebacteria bacterium]|nr:50S ribosomal protein L18 [Candidatus Paceibacterota bacterium]
MATLSKKEGRVRRHNRIRAKIAGTTERPRLAVFRSNRYISAQLIDDTKGVTIASATSRGMKGGMRESAVKVGGAIAKAAKELGVATVVFDRGGFTYSGTIESLATGARDGGLTF